MRQEQVGHDELTEVVLGELAGEPLEAHFELRAPGPELRHQRVERRLLPGVALQRRAPQDLLGGEFGVVREDTAYLRLYRLRETGPADLPALALGRVVNVAHGVLLGDAADRPDGDTGVLGDLGLGVTGGEEDLDGVALKKWKHPTTMPPPPPPWRQDTAAARFGKVGRTLPRSLRSLVQGPPASLACAPGSRTPLARGVKDEVWGRTRSAGFTGPPARSGQNFWNRGGQSCWN